MNTGSKIGVTAVIATTLVAAVVIGGIGIGGQYLADDPTVSGQSVVNTDLGATDAEATVQIEEVDGAVTQLYPKETIELDESEQLKLTTALKTVGVDVNADIKQLDTAYPNSIWTTVTVTVDGKEVDPEAYRPTGDEMVVVTVESTPNAQYH